ncbi:hypothetical protein ACFSGI_14065 [Paenibacillus nicotianae]|uniref:S1 motif domain-containing protein n=1 Tax=Paenibacillus nicotianae TaxID=1526551 RepID=A0ABW4UUF0_9BACL
MEYIKSFFEDEIYYFEIDDQQIAYRQMVITDNQSKVSIAPDFMLAETEVEYEPHEKISVVEFEIAWESAISTYRKQWDYYKQQYLPGDSVTGVLRMFYPQGCIIQLDEHTYAIADRAMLPEQIDGLPLGIGIAVAGRVSGYDEQNLWVQLDQCTIHHV